MRHSLSLAALLLGPLAGCDNQSSAINCSAAGQKSYVYDFLRDWYLWQDSIPTDLNLGPLAGPEAVVDAVRYHPPEPATWYDSWSYVTTQAANSAFYSSGRYVGIGISQQFDAAGALHITQIFAGSPAAAAGLVRGDIIDTINGLSPQSIQAANSWATAWGDNTAGVQVALGITDASGNASQLTLTKAAVTIASVQSSAVLSVAGNKVGYVLLDDFIDTTPGELNAAFDGFLSAGIADLVLDIRYDGGGLVSGAQYLASLIGGSAAANQIFASFQFNSRHAGQNFSLAFAGDAPTLVHALSVPRVFVLTTKATASASELVINGLAPYMTVIQVGTDTDGKPVGMLEQSFCDQALVPIMFASSNAAGQGGYFSGLTPACAAADDFGHDLGDPAEALLAAALYYVQNGSCPPVAGTNSAQALGPERYWFALPGLGGIHGGL